MIKMADTCKPLGQFPVAEAEDIDFADGESLQKKLDDGSLGGGSGSWNGTREDFEKLDKNLLKDGQQLNFTDDYNKNVIDDSKTSGVSTWSSQKISDELGEKITWKLFGQTSDKTPVAISECNELMVTFFFENAGIIMNIPILYEDITTTVRHFCNSFNVNSSLQLDVNISATTSQVAISSAMWGGTDVSYQCGITVRYR